jgi:hypothetical protein
MEKKVKRIDISEVGSETRMVLWIPCLDEYRMKDCPYAFTWLDQQVTFMYGGWESKQPRPIGTAQTLEEARRLASEWLERYV